MLIVNDRLIRFFETILHQNGIVGLAFWPFIIVPSTTEVTERLLTHERIHLRQQRELLVIPFHIWYLIALYRKGYYNISFEKEAYINDRNPNYLKKRKPYSFWKYIQK